MAASTQHLYLYSGCDVGCVFLVRSADDVGCSDWQRAFPVQQKMVGRQHACDVEPLHCARNRQSPALYRIKVHFALFRHRSCDWGGGLDWQSSSAGNRNRIRGSGWWSDYRNGLSALSGIQNESEFISGIISFYVFTEHSARTRRKSG